MSELGAVGDRTVVVQGLRELSRAFKLADKSLQKELRQTLREVAEPVRVDAERLALANITRIGIPWSEMRVGVTQTIVYVAPRQRGTKVPLRKRPNLKELLLGRAMEPALDRNIGEVVAGFNAMLGTVGLEWEAA